jgi:hypothetical protein
VASADPAAKPVADYTAPMRTLQEPQFHMLMAGLVVASVLIEQEAPNLVTGLALPDVGLLTFTLGVAWIALFAAHRIRSLSERIDALEQRLRRTTETTQALEDEARARRSLPRL